MKTYDIPQTLLTATGRILRPLVKILLRYGVSYTAFSELSKQVYFDVAKTQFALPGKKQTASRISTMTGLSRKEVARLEALPENARTLDTSGINRAARVISGWVRDAEFNDTKGNPADLPFDAEDRPSFSALVKKYSGDITARTIADELGRVGDITVTAAGDIRLNTRAYIANASDLEKLTLLGTDVPDMIATIDHNLTNAQNPFLQRKVSYNYLPAETMAELRPLLVECAQSSLEKMDDLLAARAINKNDADAHKTYLRAGIGIYYFEGTHS